MRAVRLPRLQRSVSVRSPAASPLPSPTTSPLDSPRLSGSLSRISASPRRSHSLGRGDAGTRPSGWRQLSLSRSVMHKLQFARGIGQRDLLRANTLPSITRARVGCFARLHIYEENARFVLISLLVLLYLCFGALLFNYLERDQELKEREEYKKEAETLRMAICNGSAECLERLEKLLDKHGEATLSGVNSGKDRFDLLGAFFFSATVISTIGFGTSTPRTPKGRVFTCIYGVFGCTCCVLFFNLCLERLITAFSYALRYFHERKVKRRMMVASNNKPITLLVNNEDYAESASSCEAHDTWRPSVYKVFFCLSSLSLLLIATAAAIYAHAEDWHYIDALYFCFISFATIGFGDYVSNQKEVTALHSDVYRVVNFFLLTLGACCFYCLFNVSSIVVRQLLNWIIKKIDVKVDDNFLCFKKPKRYMGLGLRPPKGYDMSSERSSIDCQTDGLLSLKEFLMNNQSSVLLLQKHLIKSAMKNVRDKEEDEQKISATRVGPMGILSQTFGDE